MVGLIVTTGTGFSELLAWAAKLKYKYI